jgi:hypothetical protein
MCLMILGVESSKQLQINWLNDHQRLLLGGHNVFIYIHFQGRYFNAHSIHMPN